MTDDPITNGDKRNADGTFAEGNAGGPGRPKGSGLKLTPLLKAKLEEVPEGQKESYKELFIKSLLHKALVEKDGRSMKLIINYVDGLPKQEIDNTLKGEIIVKLTKYND